LDDSNYSYPEIHHTPSLPVFLWEVDNYIKDHDLSPGWKFKEPFRREFYREEAVASAVAALNGCI
jgi:hypothetical protein